MGTALIVFSSSTTASRLKKLAFNEQLRGVSMIQTPKVISQNGCTYSLKCSMSVLPSILRLADQYNIRHGYVYKELTDREGRKSYQRI